MTQIGGKDSKRHFTVVMGGKEHGLYVSSTPSSAARKAVTKLCAANKSKKVEFSIREITQGSKKKTYGPYKGHIEKLKEPIELKGRVIRYKPVAKLSGKKGVMKGGLFELKQMDFTVDFSKGNNGNDPTYKYDSSFVGKDKLFFGPIFSRAEENGITRQYFPILLYSDGSTYLLSHDYFDITSHNLEMMSKMINASEKNFTIPTRNKNFSEKINNLLDFLNLSKFLHGQHTMLLIQSFLRNDLTLEDFKIDDGQKNFKYIKNIFKRNILFFGIDKKISLNNIDYYPFVFLCGRDGYTILVFEQKEKENGTKTKYYILSSYNSKDDTQYLSKIEFFKYLSFLENYKENNNKTSLWGKDFHNCIKSVLNDKISYNINQSNGY
jgi:hypothetical protein